MAEEAQREAQREARDASDAVAQMEREAALGDEPPPQERKRDEGTGAAGRNAPQRDDPRAAVGGPGYDRGRAAAEAAEVEAPTLHECRHGYASLTIAAGVNVKALSTFMGHANIRITLDQYGHLLPGTEDEAATLLDAFLARQLGGSESEPTAPQTALHPA